MRPRQLGAKMTGLVTGYTAVGALESRGADYAFSSERDGQTYTGTRVRPRRGGVTAELPLGEGRR